MKIRKNRASWRDWKKIMDVSFCPRVFAKLISGFGGYIGD
jgi:hypothetical protein